MATQTHDFVFLDFYNKLNSAQKKAVDTIEGPVMVLAGPGTGKTQVLTLRIANILRLTDTEPGNILALTFTDAAAANMRRRLVSIVGSAGYYVNISTYHSFANRLIQESPDYFPSIIGAASATEGDRIAIIRQIIDENELKILKPFGDIYYYVLEILSAIRDLKNEGLRPQDFKELIKKSREKYEADGDKYHTKGAHKGKIKGEYQKELRQIEKNEELSGVYEKYEASLHMRRLFDFEDMILEVVKALESNEGLALGVQEKYQYVLVDEHQDSNGAQNRLLMLITGFHSRPNLFVVGDEKQAIYRFQGANIENFLSFKDAYDDAVYINLEENYRSTQSILDAAGSVIQANKVILSKVLKSQVKSRGEKIRLYSFPSEEEEFYFLASTIKSRISDGVIPSEIAILYRDNSDAWPIVDALSRSGVSYVLESDENILTDPEIRKFIVLLKAVLNYPNDEYFVPALHIDFLEIDLLDVYKLLDTRRGERFPLLYGLAIKEKLVDLKLNEPETLHKLALKMKLWKRRSVNDDLLVFMESLIHESGLLKHILGSEAAIAKLEKLNVFFNEVRKFAASKTEPTLQDFVYHLEILREHKVSLKAKPERRPEAVRLMTTHKAKGQEFDMVFMADVVDGKWGNRRMRSSFDLPIARSVDLSDLEKNEDERRLFYVALTRARKEVFITYSERSFDGREQVPSQFIEEIAAEHKEVTKQAFPEELKRQELYFMPKTTQTTQIRDRKFISEMFAERGLSVTGLNNYLECPWRYFYTNLLRIPRAKTLPQIYGTAAHAALKKYFDVKAGGGDFGEDEVLQAFEFSLKREAVQKKERERVVEKARVLLLPYIRHYREAWNYKTINEFVIQGVEIEPGIKLLGTLDKMELRPGFYEVTVVDYKTKKPESRNWIEGKTANSTGNYKRQLVFYKILLELKPNNSYRLREGVIDFLEPNERGIYKREVFEVSDEEVRELKETIKKVADEITTLAFWERRCENKECEYCELKRLKV